MNLDDMAEEEKSSGFESKVSCKAQVHTQKKTREQEA